MSIKDPPYGTKRKKIVFYDTDKRYADLKIRLQYDGISQAHFFRCLVTGYIEKDEDIINIINKLKEDKNLGKQKKSDITKSKQLIKKGKEIAEKISFDDREIASIFDILEQENPDL